MRDASALATQSRLDAALGVLPSLALPAELRDLEKSPLGANGATRWDGAEWSLLRRGLDALIRLTDAHSGAALRAEADGSVLVLRNRGDDTPQEVSAEDAAPLAQFFDGRPRLLSAEQARGQMPELRELLVAGERTSVIVAPVPVFGPPLTFALTIADQAPPIEPLTAMIVALNAACGAGCQAIRLRRRVADEAQARDAFISFAAHELRSPVTSTKGYAQLLARQARKHPLPEPMLHSIRAIEEQSGRMGDMVGELLDATRIRRGELDVLNQEMDVVPLVEKLIERVRSRVEQYRVDLDIRAPSLVGTWDPQRVEHILRDLLDNGMRFSPESNRILVTVDRERDMAAITVRDEGIGVAPQDRERIFDYLYRAPAAQRRNLGGLGLGLYVSRFLAERMGGSLVLLDSSATAPTGSAFRLLLPLAMN